MSRINETKHIEQHKTCKCKCRLDTSVCNNKKKWNNDKYECKELIDKGICDIGFISNPSNCECECDKSCDVREYLDYENFKCRKKLIDKLVEECIEIINENEMIYNGTLNGNKNVCESCERSFCTVYILLFVIAF